MIDCTSVESCEVVPFYHGAIRSFMGGPMQLKRHGPWDNS